MDFRVLGKFMRNFRTNIGENLRHGSAFILRLYQYNTKVKTNIKTPTYSNGGIKNQAGDRSIPAWMITLVIRTRLDSMFR